ncbi:ankyrin repeat domain-containing protein [Wolbachia endosymbiont (group B) of Elophila nymphaeata]|uniref:ankyrin repeat domain-containing protein n=1 Tax=Wolbachia endosymbiont (group B) of Elophila nymphaeata TaxID=3066173 RepID=UPI003132A475
MLKVEHSIDYLKRGRSSSEIFEGAKHVKQIISQRKALRFKRSDDNPELPENFKVGQAIGGGDCFFDSVAKGLKQLKPEMDFTVKSLREVCKRFAQSQLENDQSWLKGALRNEAEPISVYVPRIEFTADDIEQKSGSVNVLELTSPIWGRSEIEGRIICKEYNVKLHVVEKHVVEGKEVWLDQVVNSEGSRSMDSIDYNEENTIHIINRGNAHFEPILGTQEIRHNKQQSPDPSDYDDEITPEEELINIIKSRDSEEEKLARIKRVFEKEPKPDIDFQGKDNDTPLHIAVRKKELKVIEWLIKNGAKIDIKNSRGRTQLEVAQHLERQDIVEVLKSHIQLNLKASVEEQSASQQQSQQKRTKTDSKEDKLEDSNPKKQKTSSPDGQPMGVDQDTSSRKKISILDGKNTYDASGLKHTLHGVVYQLKLLMLFLKRGLNKSYNFRLATEMDAAEKFDDLVFQYENERKDGKVYRFLQAKHKQDESKKIAVNDLLTEKDEDFSLQKYFLSYRKIKQNPEFNDKRDELKDFVICTNIDLGDDLQNSFERLEDEDDIISIKVGNNSKEPKRLKFKEGGSLKKESLTSIFIEVSDLKRLAKKLAEYVFGNNNNNKIIGLKDDLFKKYHGALAERVIDIQTKKFKEDFVSGSSNLPEEVKEFRKVLLEKSGLSEEDFKRDLKTKSLKISGTFGKVLKLEENPQINRKKTSNNSPDPSQELAEHIANLIVNGNIGTPIKIQQRANIIKENIAKLIGHVFVETEDGGKKKFRQGFLNGDELPGNLNDFRKELKKSLKSIQFSQLDQYQFEINVHTCTEEDYKEYKKKGQDYFKLLPIPNDKVSNEEIDDFLDKLVFAVNQPNEVELGNIIEAEMGEEKDINLIDSELIASKFQKDMLDWMKEKKGRFLSYKDGENFFKEAKQKLSKLVLIGPTLEYRAKIEDFGIAFSEEPSGLSNFLASNKRQIFNLVNPHKTILSSIKVCQTLKGIPNYQKDDSHIFIRLSSLLLIQNRAIEAFKSNDLLIIECDYTNKAEPNQDVLSLAKDVQRLYSSLKSKLNGNKKIILITKENDLLANKFKSALRDKYQEKKDEKNSLTDLTPESQVKLLKRGKVTFQGEEVSLGRLVDNGSKHLLDGEVLSKLINHEKIKVGKALIDSKYEDIKDYYIPRTFNHQVKIKEGLKEKYSEFLVTYNSQIDEQSLKKNQDIVLISATDNGFKELCNKYKERNIHWLKQEGDDLIWQQSYGALSKLRDFIDTNEQAIQEYKPEKITDIKDRVVIISAEPGMGKSTVLNPLALKTKDSLWVIRINLLDYSTELKRETEKKTKLNKAEAIKFLYRIVGFQLFQEQKEETTEKKKKREQTIEKVLSAITVKDSEVSLEGAGEEIKGLNLLEIGLFNNFYNQGRIALLFDGFDEISPKYTEKVIELLQVLKNSEVKKLWITTRPYNFIQAKLEDQLSIFSYSLKPFLPKEQKVFLRKFWKAELKLNELDEQRSGVFIDELLGKLPKSIGDKNFMSIPLHAFMVAEVFKDAFKSFYDSNEKELSDEHKRKIEEQDLVTLYERFIYIKFYEIRFGEKKHGMNIDDLDMKGMVEEEREKFIANHMKLALYAIFNEDEVKELLSQEEIGNVTKLIKKIKQGEERTGLIKRVIDGKPGFVHRTFAEYFSASYFWERFKSVKSDKFEDFVENIITKNLIEDDRIQISKFLQLKAKKDFESNIDFPDKQNKLRTLLTQLLDQTTQYDYNGNGKKSTKLLFGIVEFSTKEKSNVDVIENNDQLKLLCVSAEMGYVKLVNVLEKKLNKEFLQKYIELDKWFYSPLWLAAKNAHLDVLEVLIKKFSYDPNWKDKDSNTLVQRIFQRSEFDVLRSCLKLDIVDGKPYEDLNHRQELPIVEVFNKVAPSDVIKLLIEKTDSNLVNGFKYPESSSKISPIGLIAVQSLKYDKEITELAIKKGIDFSKVINLLLFEYCYNSLNSPINKLNYASYNQPSFHSDKEFLNLFERIELLLKAGVEYNHKDIQYSKTTLQYAEQIHYIHKLLHGVREFHTQKIDKSSNPLDTILKLIIDNVGSSNDFEGYEFVGSNQQGISLLLNYKDKSSKYNKGITLLPNNIPELLFKFYKDSNVNLVEDALGKLRDYITNAKEEIEAFKQYSDSKVYNKIFTGYEEMLEYHRQRKDKLKFESLDLPVKELLERVLKLYIRQDYEINDALKEVEEEVLRLKEIINKLKENSGHKKYETGEILDILAIKSIDTNEELQDLISKIYECGAIQFLSETWLNLNLIGQQRIMGILELMFKFADQSSKIFELLKKLDSGYKKLTKAIENKNYQEIDNILQNVESDFIKAVINGQDDEYGSPLHYAAFKGDVQVTKILLESGANPNLKMQGSGILLSTADETQKDEDWEHDYQGCTPLHVAVFNGQLEVAKILVNCGADVNAMSTDWQETPLHMAVQSGKLNVIKFLVEKGADVNAKEERGRAPLHTAAYSGKLDVVKFLVEERKADPNTQDKDGKTPLGLAYKRLGQDPENDNLKAITGLLLSVKDESRHREEQGSISLKECLPSTSHRRKREAESECLFTWEDVDEFNTEQDEKRDFGKVNIDSEKFVNYIKDLSEEKRSQLIQLASEAQVTGRFQGLVNKLTSNQKVISHLNRVGKISGMTMHGMMAKNVLADFLNGNYQGVAINVGFIAGGQGFAKVAEAASLKGLELASEGKLLLGRSLRAASPFLARGTSAFVVYDLVNQVKAFKNGTEEALVGVVGDSIYLGVDAAEIGVEVAEAFGVLEGVSSVTGPIGAAIGAVVFVGTDIYMAVKRVDKIDEIIHLTGKERFVEGLRAFIGMKPEPYIEDLMEKKQLYNQLVKQGLEYLKVHSNIQSYVFPTTDSKFKPDLDSKVVLDRKRTGIRWSRARPDDLNGGRVFCLPQGNDEPAPDYGSYLCENAIGLSYSANRIGNYTLVDLGDGNDKVVGFKDSPHIFQVGNGSKDLEGGDKDDTFVLHGDETSGKLDGGDGIDTLILNGFAQNARFVHVDLIGDVYIANDHNSIKIPGIEKVFGRIERPDTISTTCHTKFVDGQGSAANSSDIMIIRNEVGNKVCTYKIQIIVRPNTDVNNQAYNGEFNYIVLPGKGKALVNMSSLLDGIPNDRHNFFFNSTISELVGIYIQNVSQIFNYTVKSATFSFLSADNRAESAFDSQLNKGRFNITISDIPVNASYILSNGAQIKMGRKSNVYMLESSNKSSEEVIRDYLPIANRVNKMSFFIQSLLSNETVVIGSGNHEVIYSNPGYRSHLVGNGGENVYVIDSKTKEVIIHDVDEENSIDTIDLRNVVRKAKEVKVIKLENDLLLRATVKEQAEYCTVRLKDGVERYNKTHVIVENVPMRISFDNNEWSLKPQPLMFEKDKEIILVTGQDVEEGNEIITPRKGGNYKFVRSNGNDLMITNAFDLTITKNDLCTITMSKFYEEPKMATLSIKFADKEIILKEHQEEISTARNVNVVKKEHKDQVYNDVFNHTKSSPEVIMLSDQPVTHRHRHSRHREQARHRRSTKSSSTRPTGWINDLFGWVKSSVSGLLSSKPESTPSSISQVDARVDVNGTIMLFDILIRKVTGQKYVSTADQSISQLEAQGYALNITKGFEKVVEQAGLKSGVSMHRLNIDYMGMQKEITRKVMSGKFDEVSGILNSYVEKACPGREAGCPGKLSKKRFNEFMAKFNKGLDVTLNQSIEHNGDDTLEVNNIEEQQGPRSYLNNTSIQGHLTRNKVKLIS